MIEAPYRSGALITARYANELGREVFAVPGRADNRSAQGSNKLIGDCCAKLVQNLEDILVELGPISDELKAKAEMSDSSDKQQQPQASDIDTKILSILTEEPLHIDEICAKTGIAVNKVSSTLMMLELKRQVKSQPGKFYTEL